MNLFPTIVIFFDFSPSYTKIESWLGLTHCYNKVCETMIAQTYKHMFKPSFV